MIRLKDKEFSDIVQYMRDEYGINLEKKKVLIECRMSKILERYGLDSFAGYLDMVHQDRSGEMAGEMVNHLTTNYTYFYREADHFERLQDAILPGAAGAFGVRHSGYLVCGVFHRGRMLYSGYDPGGI